MGIFSFLLFFLMSTAFAFADTHCVCQTGTWPIIETPFFKLGCEVWLGLQNNCTSREKVSSGDTMRLGYVGHWMNSMDTLTYIENNIIPFMNQYDVNVVVENTACSSMNDPNLLTALKQFHSSNFPPKRKLFFRGNQVSSIGMWDKIYPFDSINFWAEIELPLGKITYPSCDDFRNKRCIGSLQAKEKGKCQLSSPTGKLLELTCKKFDARRDIWLWHE